ncbi:MAG: LON peptidase substrate-binding domain-containing protein [Bdellovibrionaceae bacterium]|nr:LON peptidase substrate-binding domain-containing protein [Pseudobdellovibrionaceae bacterium]
MDTGRAVEVFVFPLPRMVFFPGTTKPLNIFEPRYIQMINDSVEKNAPLALAFSEPQKLSEGFMSGLGVRRIAGVGRPIILESRIDGMLLVLVEAMGKVRIHHREVTDKPYMVCEAEWVDEVNALEPENIFLMNRMSKEFVRWLEANVGDRDQLAIFLSQLKSPHEKINYLCSLMIHDAETQQRLLEADDINDRLRVISLLADQQRESVHV